MWAHKKMLCHVSAWWAQPPRKGGKKSVSQNLCLGHFALFTRSWKTFRNWGVEIRWREHDRSQRIGCFKCSGTVDCGPILSLPLPLALIHTPRGEKWLMTTFPNRYAPNARRENTELINKIWYYMKPSLACCIPILVWLCLEYGFVLLCLLVTQFILSSQWSRLCH